MFCYNTDPTKSWMAKFHELFGNGCGYESQVSVAIVPIDENEWQQCLAMSSVKLIVIAVVIRQMDCYYANGRKAGKSVAKVRPFKAM